MTTEAPERTYTTVDKSEWGDGPWLGEPDKLQFTDPATGLPCLLVRGPSGAWCGYVGITEGHPFFGVYYDDEAHASVNHHCDEPWCKPTPEHVLEVHGGVTYSDFCQDGPEAQVVCHVPAPGEPDHVYWIGFDAAHAYDLSPASDARLRQLVGARLSNESYGLPPDIYRDVAYMKTECASLAAQLMAVAQGG